MKSILFVAHNFPPHWFAGVENYTFHLAKCLNRMGIQTSVLYSHHRDGIPEPVLEQETYDGIGVYKLISDYNSPRHSDLSTQITHQGKERIFIDFLQRNRFNVIHFHHTKYMPFSFIRIAHDLRFPVCVTLHDFWFLCVNVHLYNAPAKSPCDGPNTLEHCIRCLRSKIQYQVSPEEQAILSKWIQFRNSYALNILQSADSIVSPTRYLANIHHRFGISKHIEISPLGLNNLGKSSRGTHSPVVFGFLGMIHDLKNVYLLAEAFKETSGDAILKYFGDGAEQHIQRLLAAIEGNERISYHGRYSPEQLSVILDQIDVVVLPSMTENYPLVIREAFSAGIPVIASRIGGIPEIVTHLHDGILFNPSDKEELKKWLQILIAKPYLIDEMRKNIRPVKTIEQDAEEWAVRYSLLSEGP
jgi:glycosyltransferase involved in cell wall biosynthesis